MAEKTNDIELDARASKKLTKCKTCGTEIAKKAKKCPNCGAKNKKRKWWLWAIIAVIIVVAIASGGDDSSNTNDKTVDEVANIASNEAKDNAKQEKENTDIWEKGGTYKVGEEIDAGEYIVVASGYNCYIQVSKDSSGTLDSIVSNDNISTRTYITLLDGQYFTVKSGKFAPADKVVAFEPTDGLYDQGMYFVGKDIPAGEYKITANDSNCYIEVDKDSFHTLGSIISNDNISLGESTYVTVSDGQYLKFNGGQLEIG